MTRQVGLFTEKYPEYRDSVFISAEGRMVTFKTSLYHEVRVFAPYSTSAQVRGWLGTCRKVDLNLQKKRHEYEATRDQGKLL